MVSRQNRLYLELTAEVHLEQGLRTEGYHTKMLEGGGVSVVDPDTKEEWFLELKVFPVRKGEA